MCWCAMQAVELLKSSSHQIRDGGQPEIVHISLKCGARMHCRSADATELVKSSYHRIQHDMWHWHFKWLDHYNSAVDC